MNKDQLRDLTNRVLIQMGHYSSDASNLLIGTFAQESRLGYYIKQQGSGKALGIGQMEEETFNYLLSHYFLTDQELMSKIEDITGIMYFEYRALEFNIALSIAMTRLKYLSIPEQLPHTITEYANYWKKYYNTYKGKGTVEQFIKNYHKYVIG